jgi:DNA replication protein DnaC
MTKKKTPDQTELLAAINEGMRALRLPEMVLALESELDTGPPANDSRLQFLWRLIEPQHIARRQRAVERRIREARFPVAKSLDGFDFGFQPNLDKDLIIELTTLDFVRRGYNLLLGGMSGTGKTHISIAIGYAACAKGFRVRYTTSANLLSTLFASLATNSLQEAIKPFIRPQLLIIDEVGLDRPERDTTLDAGLFYKVVQARYEAALSTVITTNIDWELWPDYLGDHLATTAILDRLIHRGYTITIDGPSWRAHQHHKLNAKRNQPVVGD